MQITDLKYSCILPFLGDNSHLDKLSYYVQTSGTQISKQKKTEANYLIKKVVFHANSKAGREIKDRLNCHKRQALRTIISEVGNRCFFIKIQKQNFK